MADRPAVRPAGNMRLGAVLKTWRISNRYGVREMARILSISHATVSRFERGEMIDAATFLKILAWLTAKDTTE